jgi:hypothetical protein
MTKITFHSDSIKGIVCFSHMRDAFDAIPVLKARGWSARIDHDAIDFNSDAGVVRVGYIVSQTPGRSEKKDIMDGAWRRLKWLLAPFSNNYVIKELGWSDERTKPSVAH